MKKIIALLLCTTCSYSFGWDLDFLKPNFSTISQSWTSLSATHQNMILATSALSIVGIIYAPWSTSEQSARKEAEKEVISRQAKIASQGKTFNFTSIKNEYDQAGINPAIFSFGPFWNRNEFQVIVILGHTIIDDQTKTDIFVDLYKKRPNETTRYAYDTANKQWETILFKESPKTWYQRFFNLFLNK